MIWTRRVIASPWKFCGREDFPKFCAGGNQSRWPQLAPGTDNAIYHLVRAVDRVSNFEFPVELDDANRAYFSSMSKIVAGEAGQP